MNNPTQLRINESPNPNTFSVALEHHSFGSEIFEANSLIEAQNNIIFAAIWSLDPSKIVKIFTYKNIICIHKLPDAEWGDLQNQIVHLLQTQTYHSISTAKSAQNNDEIDQKITDTISKYVQPYIADHGGYIQYHYFKDGIAYFTLHGSCAGCPSSENTLQIAVYNVLRLKVPEINEIKTL